MARYLRVVEFEPKLQALAARPENLCTLDFCPHLTAGGRRVPFVVITHPSSSVTPRIPVLVIGGAHAREWAPPDALVSFVEKFLATKGTGPAHYPSFVQPGWPGKPLPPPIATPVVYPPFSVPADAVQSILDRVELYIAPLVNPDGRAFSRTGPLPANRLWRKNRVGRAATGAPGPCIDSRGLDQSVGVDVNRNFDIVWDIDRVYIGEAEEAVKAFTATDICPGASPGARGGSEAFRGRFDAGPMSEQEVKNVTYLMDRGARYFVDLHSYGPTILYPWGIAMTNQSADSTRNFLNPNLDSTGATPARDELYAEYVPADLEARLVTIGGLMQLGIRQTETLDARLAAEVPLPAQVRRFSAEYPVQQAAAGFYPTVGACDDYFFSRQFTAAPPTYAAMLTPPERYAFTIECGNSAQGEFWPQRDFEFPKIEREVHAALWSLLAHVAAPHQAASSAWPIVPGP